MIPELEDFNVIDAEDRDEAVTLICTPPLRLPAICAKCGCETGNTVRTDLRNKDNVAEELISAVAVPIDQTINLPCCKSCAHAHARAIWTTVACLALGFGSYWLWAALSEHVHVVVQCAIVFLGTCFMMGCFLPGLVIQHKAMPVDVYRCSDGMLEVMLRGGALRQYFEGLLGLGPYSERSLVQPESGTGRKRDFWYRQRSSIVPDAGH